MGMIMRARGMVDLPQTFRMLWSVKNDTFDRFLQTYHPAQP
jgi:hypothetical protein